MARVTASVVFADGDSVQVIAQGASNYPDALAELKHEAVDGVREILGFVRYEGDDEAEAAAAALFDEDES